MIIEVIIIQLLYFTRNGLLRLLGKIMSIKESRGIEAARKTNQTAVLSCHGMSGRLNTSKS